MKYPSAEANRHDKRDERKTLRNASTRAEALLWKVLRNSGTGYKFRRQQSIGPYILDFYCPSLKLCVELDGSSHDNRFDYDEQRTLFLQKQGIKVLRYPNEQVYSNPAWVAEDILRQGKVTDPTPCPSP